MGCSICLFMVLYIRIQYRMWSFSNISFCGEYQNGVVWNMNVRWILCVKPTFWSLNNLDEDYIYLNAIMTNVRIVVIRQRVRWNIFNRLYHRLGDVIFNPNVSRIQCVWILNLTTLHYLQIEFRSCRADWVKWRVPNVKLFNIQLILLSLLFEFSLLLYL